MPLTPQITADVAPVLLGVAFSFCPVWSGIFALILLGAGFSFRVREFAILVFATRLLS